MIYLDNASTTRVSDVVFEAALPYLKEQYGNPGTVHEMGRNAKSAIDKARKQVADFINAKPEQIIFTSGGTEANNMVFFSLCDYLKERGKTVIVTSEIEHDSIHRAIDNLISRMPDFSVIKINPNADGQVTPQSVKDVIKNNSDVGLVSVMYMNNETGIVNDVKEIGAICKEAGILFHTDCVQAAGCCEIDVDKLNCDFLSLSSHKIHGMKGTGALYARNTSILKPMISGGSSQETGLRGGTENVAGIVAFGEACEFASWFMRECPDFFHRRQQRLMELLKRFTPTTVRINGNSKYNPGKTTSISLDGIDGEALVLALDTFGVCVSSGSACRENEQEPSRTLLAMGISEEQARSTIRISFSYDTSDWIIKAGVINIYDAVESLINLKEKADL